MDRVKVRMRHSSKIEEYHGLVDVIAGDEFELDKNDAIKLIRRMPKDFEPVGWELTKEELSVGNVGPTKRIRLRYNPYLEEYHSIYGNLSGPGDTCDFPEKEAERMLSVFPKSVFEIVDDATFQEDEDNVEELLKEISPLDKENNLIDSRVLSLVAGQPKSYDELKKMIGCDPDKLRIRVMQLSRQNKIEKNDEGNWAQSLVDE